MKGIFPPPRVHIAIFAAVVLALAPALRATPTLPDTDPTLADTVEMTRETRDAAYLLDKNHYLSLSKPLDKLDQRELLRSYMSDLDSQLHLFFLQSDATAFEDKYGNEIISDVVEQGKLEPAYVIYNAYLDKVRARVAWIDKRLEGDIDLTATDTYQADRTDAAWPATQEDADKLWDKELRFELIGELLSADTDAHNAAIKKAKSDTAAASTSTGTATSTDTKSAPATSSAAATQTATATPDKKDAADAKPKTQEEKIADAKAKIRKRYDTYLHDRADTDSIEVQEIFLNTLTAEYDPHSNYWSPHQFEDFNIQMGNSLVGIGAQLTDLDGYCTIEELIPGGPAAKSGQLHPGDKVVAVGQATGDPVDVIGSKLRNTVNLIRGAENTPVILTIMPAGDSSTKHVVKLIREKIKLTANLAKAQIIEVPDGDNTIPVGVINIPTFYGKGGDGDNFSTTEDVTELIGKLKTAGVQGLILDVRNNGGGFLNEARDLTGLFIPPSPVLQVRNMVGGIEKIAHNEATPLWNGPLMLLVSKNSASATEIFAGALQDYRRALIVGDHSTHGKGTVQAVFQFKQLPGASPDEQAAAKITTEEWFLPDGNSIQSKGVSADIVLPSLIDFRPIGESDLKHALPADSVKALPLALHGDGPWRTSLVSDSLISSLGKQSAARQQGLDEFKLLNEDIDRDKLNFAQKDYSLNLVQRMQKHEDDLAFGDQVTDRVKALAKTNFKSTDLLLDAAKKQEAEKTDNKTAANAPDGKADDKAATASLSPTEGGADGESAEGEDAPIVFDVQLREGLRIMENWIQAEHDVNESQTTKVAVATAGPASATAVIPPALSSAPAVKSSSP